MNISNYPRWFWKTSKLVIISSMSSIPIVCMNENAKRNILSNARNQELKIPEPIVYKEHREIA